MVDEHLGVWSLRWNREESTACVAQGIIVKGDNVWLSCTTYLLKGTIGYANESSADGKPRGGPTQITITDSDMNALSEPRGIHQDYGHIGDGSYMELANGDEEIWFGLEDGEWPRRQNAAIVRYDAKTLQFRGFHAHPSLLHMPWLACDSDRHVAYTSDFSGVTELTVFDIDRMEWMNATMDGGAAVPSIKNMPPFFIANGGINYIQGGQVMDDKLFIISDDYKGSVIALSLDGQNAGEILSIWQPGLGNEREGMAMTHEYLFSLGNRWTTWENQSFAEVLCLPIIRHDDEDSDGTSHDGANFPFRDGKGSFLTGVLTGMGVALFLYKVVQRVSSVAQSGRSIDTRRSPTTDGDASTYDLGYRDEPTPGTEIELS